jgi:putative restriction endonuclease
MAKGIFTTKVDPPYDDIPEFRYHFPKTYLNYAQKMVGDWIIYYEPRRGGGRKSYYATARVDQIIGDQNRPNHYYALVSNFFEFENPVPFRYGDRCLENALMHDDGNLNRGAFQRSVRLLPDEEYQTISQLGFSKPHFIGSEISENEISEEIAEYQRPILEQIVSRPFRDAAFTKRVRQVYNATCAVTGLQLINGGGHCEIEAAHIRPVGNNHKGPDSVRNGVALSRTVHWMFDRGIISLSDNYDILMAKKKIPGQIRQLINPSGKINLPFDHKFYPHPKFLKYHRENIFIG